MKHKEKKVPSNRSVSELILSAIYFLQKKNGVSMKDITKYICRKRGYKQSQMKNKVKEALNRGTKNGIFNLKKGLYKVGVDCRRKLTTLKKKFKKKPDVNKVPRKMIRKKISVEKVAAALDGKKLTPIKESSDKSVAYRERVGSHTLSEDVFDRRARGNIYFEPSMLGKGSDEEYDDEEDDEEDNEDDLNSETDEGLKGDIFTFTFVDDLSQERLPEMGICNAAKADQKNACPREKKKSKCGKTRRKTKGSKSQKCPGKEERKPKRSKCCGDYEEEGRKENDEGEEDYQEEEDGEEGEGEEEETNHSAESELDVKGNKFGVRPKVKKGEKKEKMPSEYVKKKSKKEIKDIKEFREQKEKRLSSKKKGELEPAKRIKRCRKKKRQRLEENFNEENQDGILKKDKSFSRSDCVIISSTELLPRGFKFSVSPPLMVSDVKFCPTNIKFESQDSLTLLLSDKVKEEEPPEDKVFSDFKIFCECESPKRKNRSSSCGVSFENDMGPVLKRIKSRRSEK